MYTGDTKEKEKENITSPLTPKGKREKLKTTLKSNLHKQTVVEHAFFWPTRAIQTVLFPQRVITSKKKNALNRLVETKNKKRVISPLRPAQFFRQAHLVLQLSTILQVLFSQVQTCTLLHALKCLQLTLFCHLSVYIFHKVQSSLLFSPHRSLD